MTIFTYTEKSKQTPERVERMVIIVIKRLSVKKVSLFQWNIILENNSTDMMS